MEKAVLSIIEQNITFNNILVIDDGSQNSNKLEFLEKYEVSIIKNKKNMGRGFCRNLAIQNLTDPFILFLDATNTIKPGYAQLALSYFVDESISAVSGLIHNCPNNNFFASNWRSRHLFKQEHNFGNSPHYATSLTTYGTIFKRSAVLDAGNFQINLKHSEDKDLGRRLFAAGYKIIGDPNLVVYSIKKESLFSVLERYWRWYGGEDERMSFQDYWKAIKASFKPMIQKDLKAKDWRSTFVSFLCPHYGYMRYLYRKTTGKLQIID